MLLLELLLHLLAFIASHFGGIVVDNNSASGVDRQRNASTAFLHGVNSQTADVGLAHANKHILRLDVSVDDLTLAVQVVHTLEQLETGGKAQVKMSKESVCVCTQDEWAVAPADCVRSSAECTQWGEIEKSERESRCESTRLGSRSVQAQVHKQGRVDEHTTKQNAQFAVQSIPIQHTHTHTLFELGSCAYY